MGALKESIAGKLKTEFEARVKRHREAQDLIDKGKQDDLKKAAGLFRENVDWSLSRLGEDHAATVWDQEQLSYILNQLLDFKGAKDLDEKVLETRTRVEGRSPPSIDLLETERNLANDYLRLKKNKRAAELYESNYNARRKHPKLGENHWITLQTGHDLGTCWYRLGEFHKAAELHAKVLEQRIRARADEKYIILTREALALDRYKEGKIDEAIALNKGNLNALQILHLDLTLQKVLHDAKKSNELWEREAEREQKEKWPAQKGEQIDPPKKLQVIENTEATKPIPIPQIKVQPDHHQSRSLPKHNTPDLTPSTGNNETSGADETRRPRANTQKPRPVSEIFFRHIASSDALSQIRTVEHEHDNSPFGNPTPSAPTQKPKRPHRNSLQPGGPAQSNPELDRARSTSPHQNKANIPVRAKSVSPAPTKPKRQQRQLFDGKEGSKDDDSVRNWFGELEDRTQALLAESRQNNPRKRIKIAILDTGIDTTHPDFANDLTGRFETRRIKKKEDFLDIGGTAFDTCGHGTHCLGLLRKIAPEADIYVARVVKDFNGYLDPEIVVKAIDRACKDGKDDDGRRNWDVDILTMSFGFYSFNAAVSQAIWSAISRPKPVLIFVAASNNGTMKEMTFPADTPGVFCVNSASAEGNPSDFNPPLIPGKEFSIIGENVRSAWVKTAKDQNPASQKSMSGTSVATPILAAVAALVLEFALQDADEEQILKDSFQEHLRRYNGMAAIFNRMHRPRNGYKNIVPWNVLNKDYGRRRALNMVDIELFKSINR